MTTERLTLQTFRRHAARLSDSRLGHGHLLRDPDRRRIRHRTVIQKGAVNLAPAWTLFAIVIFGAIFGAMGVALAAPIFAVARVATLRFYVEDWLGDRTHAERTGGAA